MTDLSARPAGPPDRHSRQREQIQHATSPIAVIGGIDTHKHLHHAAVLDTAGRLLGHAAFPASPAGHAALLGWLCGHGQLQAVGVEGTGSHGAGLTRFLVGQRVKVVEVNRQNRQDRRARGKTDALDAERAARAVLAQTAHATPKTTTGQSRSCACSGSSGSPPSSPAPKP